VRGALAADKQPGYLPRGGARWVGRRCDISGMAGGAGGEACTTRAESQRQPVEVVQRNRTDERDLPGAPCCDEPAQQAGHGCTLVGEHAHVALGAAKGSASAKLANAAAWPPRAASATAP